MTLPPPPRARAKPPRSLRVSFTKGYAALDAYVSTVLHSCIEEKSDPIFKEGEDSQAGGHVCLYTRTGNACVGVGVVQEYEGQV